MTRSSTVTATAHELDESSRAGAFAGLVVAFSGGRALSIVLPLDDLGEIVFGRDVLAALGVVDDQLSRAHFRVSRMGGGLSPQANRSAPPRLGAEPARFELEDLGSRNGTRVNGVAATSRLPLDDGAIVRAGRSILVFRVDAQPFESRPLRAEDGVVLGPALEHVLEFVRTVAVTTRTLCIRGETGSGKEIVARAFHAAAGRAGRPFVAVNCATIQPSLAERLLFGAKRGAFSGAGEDADGYAQAADRGTLFLDEIGELDAQVQAKLLRFLETGEILPVGDSRPRSVAVSLVCASHRDLAEEVRLGRFRSDLYFRVSQPFVVVPPLRERREEIPHYVVAHLAAAPDKPEPSAAFIEAVMLEAWPGNVRQLLRSLDAAVVHARVRSANILLPTDLQTSSPSILGVEPSGPPSPPRPATVDESPLDDDDVRRALAAESGNVSRAARLLGVHRNRVRRWLEKHGRAALPAGAQDPMEDTMESAAHPKSSA